MLDGVVTVVDAVNIVRHLDKVSHQISHDGDAGPDQGDGLLSKHLLQAHTCTLSLKLHLSLSPRIPSPPACSPHPLLLPRCSHPSFFTPCPLPFPPLLFRPQIGKDNDTDAVNEAVEQVAYADRVIINKTDLVGRGWARTGGLEGT